MNELAVPSGIVGEILARQSITAEDVRRLRYEVFSDGVVQRSEAEAVFRLDRVCRARDGSWPEFYVDALTDYFVWRARPTNHVDTEKAAFLLANIERDGRIESTGALELLINVIHWAESCPKELAVLALGAVRESVLDPDVALYGAGRRPGAIDAVDVEVIRRVICAGAGNGGYRVSRGEAEILFDLERRSDPVRNDKGWRSLFVQGVANYLIFSKGLPARPDAEAASRRESWLRERRGIGLLLMDVGQAFGSFDFTGVRDELDLFGTRRVRETETGEAAEAAAERVRAAIDRREAAWLLNEIEQLERKSDSVDALFDFIVRHASRVDPLLRPLMQSTAA